MAQPILTVRGLSKSYGPRQVLDDISFTVNPGEILGLIGPNGAGKTTLFECLAGLLPRNSGQIDGLPLFYLPDAIRPWPNQTIDWALRFLAQSQPYEHLLQSLQLTHLRRSRIAGLSKGENKRLLLALALLTPQPLLLLDEPFDGLDFRQTRDIMTLLRTIPATGRTLFLSIHQLTDAARVCDRFLLLNQGRVAAQGTLPELQIQAVAASASANSPAGLEEVFLALLP